MRTNGWSYLKPLSILTIAFMAPILSAAADFKPIYVSCLVPKGQGCVWLKIGLPDGKKETLAEFSCPNYGARVSWKPGLQEAVVWFDPRTYLQVGYGDPIQTKPGYETEELPDFKTRLYQVDLKSKVVQPIPFPVNPEYGPDEIAYTAKGELAAFDTAGPEPKKQSPDDIDNATARAFHLKNGIWVEFEDKPTTAEEDDAVGIDALDSMKNVGPRTVDLLQCHDSGETVEDKATMGRLKKMMPKGLALGAGDWRKIETPYGPVYLFEMGVDEFAFTSGLIVLEHQGQLVPLPDEGFTEGDLVGLLRKGPYLLMASAGAGCHPRVYDIRTGELVFKSNTARATVFWPDMKKSKDEK